MSTAAEIRSRTNFYAGQLLIAALLIGYGTLAALIVPLFQGMREIVLYLIPIALIYLNILAFRIATRGQGKIPTIPFIIVAGLIFGGAAFDMLATVIYSPELNLEGNLYTRILINSGQSLSFIYGYAIVVQFLLQLFFCILWGAFLRYRETLIELAWEANPKSKFQFLKAAFGMERYTWQEMLFSFKATLDYCKHSMLQLLMFFVCVVIAVTPFRWWLSAKWFGIVPNLPDPIIVLMLALLGIILYFVWLLHQYTVGAQNPSST